MFNSAPCPVTAAMWLVAVVGAGAVLVAPITPWALPLEVMGGTVCVIASGALFAWFFRR